MYDLCPSFLAESPIPGNEKQQMAPLERLGFFFFEEMRVTEKVVLLEV